MSIDHTQPTAVLCGDLNMLRCFAGTGVPTLAVSPHVDDITFRSRYCHGHRVIASYVSDPGGTLRNLVTIGRSFAQRPVLYYGDDAMLLLVSRNREELGRYFRFVMPEADLVEDLANKTRFAALAHRVDLPAPRTVLSAEALSAREVARRLSLPCILKPNSHVGWFNSSILKEEGGRPKKVLLAQTMEDLTRLYARMQAGGSEFVVQEYIPGGEEQMYSFHAYLDRHGEPLGHYVGRKIRTYPSAAGVSTYIRLVHEPRVVELGLRILRKLSYVGVVKIDFKYDSVRDRFHLLEINARYNLWNYLGAASGVNLPHIAFLDQTGQERVRAYNHRTSLRWLSLGDDMRAFVRNYHVDGRLSWAAWLWSLMRPAVYDVFAWRDPAPWIVLTTRTLRRRWARLKGATRCATPSLPISTRTSKP